MLGFSATGVGAAEGAGVGSARVAAASARVAPADGVDLVRLFGSVPEHAARKVHTAVVIHFMT